MIRFLANQSSSPLKYLALVETVLTLLTGLRTAQLIAGGVSDTTTKSEHHSRRNRLMWPPRKFDKFPGTRPPLFLNLSEKQ